MKLLLDDNLSFRLLKGLATSFPGSTHVRSCGLRGASDRDIWRFAGQNNFAILTLDADFHEMSLLRGWPPKVLWLRTLDATTRNVGRILAAREARILSFLRDSEHGCLEIVDRG